MQLEGLSEDVNWKKVHPCYGPCDGFGPDNSCSECTGLMEHRDGSITMKAKNGNRVLVKRPPLSLRFKKAWAELYYGKIGEEWK